MSDDHNRDDMGSAPNLDALYKEIMLEHHHDPRNFGPLAQADVEMEGYNPLCGDHVWLRLKRSATDAQRIEECRFEGEGCSICMASASMMTEEVKGKSISDAQGLVATFRSVMQSEKEPEVFADSDLSALTGVRKFPVRIKCALLPWTTLKDALTQLGGKSS